MAAVSEGLRSEKPNIVLVHGAFADASGWGKVIQLLTADGYFVTAVQNPLTSLADDIATTRRVIDAQTGPTVVVGHSYGGFVISGAASGAANVKALVYVAAFAPDEGETIGEVGERFPKTLLADNIRPDAAGYLYIDRTNFHTVFCADIDADDSLVMAASQKPVNSSSFGAKAGPPAWKTIPSFYQVSEEDQAIHPDQERFYAERMQAKTISLPSSHVSFLSHPAEIAALIVEAATV